MFARNSFAVALLTTAVLGWYAAPSHAQNPGLNPTYGSVSLKAGFTPDPFIKNLTAGGPIRTKLGGVSAFVANAPDFRLNYTKGGFRLTIRVESAKDTTLLINTPNGQWIANDDGAGAPNPEITFNVPQSGRYDIFVGTFNQGSVPARLIIHESGQPSAPTPTNDVPDPNLRPSFGTVSLKAGFLPDPFTRNFLGGGHIKMTVNGVTGFVAKAPDIRLNYTKGGNQLTIRAQSKADTTLLISLPDGRWVASDDANGSLNPSITFNAPQSGRYDIYVGTFRQGPEQAKLTITER
ncbi:MAG: hypothetical protein U0744_18850 [Gemmataceae bacterium]